MVAFRDERLSEPFQNVLRKRNCRSRDRHRGHGVERRHRVRRIRAETGRVVPRDRSGERLDHTLDPCVASSPWHGRAGYPFDFRIPAIRIASACRLCKSSPRSTAAHLICTAVDRREKVTPSNARRWQRGSGVSDPQTDAVEPGAIVRTCGSRACGTARIGFAAPGPRFAEPCTTRDVSACTRVYVARRVAGPGRRHVPIRRHGPRRMVRHHSDRKSDVCCQKARSLKQRQIPAGITRRSRCADGRRHHKGSCYKR